MVVAIKAMYNQAETAVQLEGQELQKALELV
jgi:hypothetical protein